MDDKLKLAIIGPGAMGCMLAGYIAHSGCAVSILDYKSDRAERLSEKGIEIEKDGNLVKVFPFVTVNALMLGIQNVVILLVKAGRTPMALDMAMPMIGEKTVVLSLQNGLGHEDVLSRFVRLECIALGVTAQGATLLREGYVRHSGAGDTKIGLLRRCGWSEDVLKVLARIFSDAGWPCSVESDIFPYIWKKLLANAGINAITALTGIKNGEICGIEGAQRLQDMAVTEAWTVAVKRGIKIGMTLDESLSFVRDVCERTKGNISSMLQDRLSGRLTEIDWINGAVVKQGRESGIGTPVNEVLSTLVEINSLKGWTAAKHD